MKYVSLPEADYHVLGMVKSDMVALGRQIQLYATPSVMPGFIVFSRSPNNTPGLTPTRVSRRYMVNRTWYMDIFLSVGMTPSC